VSGVTQAKRHAGGQTSRARVFDAVTNFDCVREHVLDTIDLGDQVARSGGWVGLLRQISCDLLVGGDRVAFDDEAGGWSGECRRH
jgi:hypothetical protein